MAEPSFRRVEDERLVTGTGRYIDDETLPGQAHAVFVRSPFAFANISAIDTATAATQPGVVAVLTARDMSELGNVTIAAAVPGRDGRPLVVPRRPALADGVARHSGEAVALVIAESEAAARDAAELVTVDYAERAPVVDVERAVAADAPQIWPEAPGNVAVDWGGAGTDAATGRELDAIFARAAHVARVRLANERIVVASLEPRAALASWNAASGRYVLRCGSQSAYVMQQQLEKVLGIGPKTLQVLTGDVGGAFGMKTPAYPEYAALLVAARKLGRPVKWIATRSEAFLSDNQGRDWVIEASLALDADGRFTGLRIAALADMGAYLTSHSAFISTINFARCLPSVYDIPKLSVEVRCVFTNTVPTGPYRGAGRPEANYTLERLVDAAARVSGIDRLELRRRNLVRPAQIPYSTPVGTTYDSGDFPAVLDHAVRHADVAGFAARRAEAAARGRRRGLGISCFLEIAGGQPGEGTAVSFPGESRLLLAIGVGTSGQGHATVFRRLIAERLGIPVEAVEVAQGDSTLPAPSAGAVASRSMMSVGGAVVATVGALIAKGRRIAADVLEAAEADIAYRSGVFEVAGTDRRVNLLELAERAKALRRSGVIAEDLDTAAKVDVPPSFPNGCHVAEIEIDEATGAVTVERYTAVDDCGTVVEPVIVDGQVQGGIAQGVGQALMEHGLYDPASGQLLASSFNDYAMPRADTLPAIDTAFHPTECRTNALGVKGVGEAGTTASLAAIMNAVADALPAGAELDMPATPQRVWRALDQG
jgi:carbon-monoxide dehydrogenase large subunit